MQTQTARQAYLDWLRILAILGVLFFHSAMPYVAEWGWHLKNNQTSNLLMEFNFWLSRFRMPLLFFISGTVTWFMLQKRNGTAFIGLRFRRLFIPLLAGTLLIVPPQVYLERVSQGYTGSYRDFYPSVFKFQPYPNGNFSWHHLWFIAYLFVYDVIFAPLFSWMVRNHQRPGLTKLFNWLSTGWNIYLLAIPGVLIYTFFAWDNPATNDLIHDYCYFFYWLFFLLTGFICICYPGLMNSLERNRRISLAVGIASILFINYWRWNGLEDGIHTKFYTAVYPVMAYAWVFSLVGYGKRYLNRPHRSLNYLNQMVYPFYILHQTVIVILTFYVIRTTDTILMKYLFTVLLTFFISIILIHVFIRPFGLSRWLFGMKAGNLKQQ
ncbi:acyltransferase family protein [Pseudobacter ginsenosidimutans]|uniref:Peptidoglycan/LPS O-acetylase OafA/YrhL n=1 Tax=Pseudobacter ginsenosidimutans TaxID=661488 RepID=A0A4V2F205_9BACT|nr:acyltransferase family protein [Pseudobacter ginsenosidimutans]QEC44149.1 acyltransferase family protein [Pseudobacter ginsenosidimutans]RZS75597.1 peptidoglycan/LPS O-acetylase OafA/YrhL [Pseudobacter ginsenosidimutans]